MAIIITNGIAHILGSTLGVGFFVNISICNTIINNTKYCSVCKTNPAFQSSQPSLDNE
jgi:hypothetical protein